MDAGRRSAVCARGGHAKLARSTFLALLVPAAVGLSGSARQVLAQEGPPARIERSLDHAHRLLRAGRAVEAGRVLETLLDEHPASVHALALLFDVTEAIGEPEDFVPFAATAARHTGTGEPAVQELWVRGLLRADRIDEARTVAEGWVQQRRTEPRAYAALAAVHTADGRPGRAIESLERGRGQVGDGSFRSELATLYAEVGRSEDLAAEWLLRLAERPPDLAAVRREIEELDGSGAATEALWSAVSEPNRTQETRHAAALLALRLGRAEPARRMVGLALPDLPPDRASVALAAYVREAEAAGLSAEAAWGAMRLSEVAGSPRERRRWLALAGEKALQAGDTASALAAAERLAAQAPPGSEAATVAQERLVVLLAASPSGVDGATRQLASYVLANPDSSRKIADLTLAVAEAHVRKHRLAAAVDLLREAPVGDGTPRHGLDAALAVLELQRGRAAEARERLRSAATGEGGPQDLRTRWISLLAVLEEADSAEVTWLARALAAAAAEPATFDPAPLTFEWTGSPAADGRAAALAYLAGQLEASARPDAAIVVHNALVRELPDSPEAPAAMLALGRHALDSDPARGRAWLERLVTRFPDSVMAPLARRMLAEQSGRAPARR